MLSLARAERKAKAGVRPHTPADIVLVSLAHSGPRFEPFRESILSSTFPRKQQLR